MTSPTLTALISSAAPNVQGRVLRWLLPINGLWVMVGVWVTYFRRRPKGAPSLVIVLLISAMAALFLVTGVRDLIR